jgi:Rad3-related DNA helicase
LPERQVLILDEGHKLEKVLTDRAAFEFTPKICSEIGVDVPSNLGKEQSRIVDWLGIVLLPAINERLKHGRQISEQSERVATISNRTTGINGSPGLKKEFRVQSHYQ